MEIIDIIIIVLLIIIAYQVFCYFWYEGYENFEINVDASKSTLKDEEKRSVVKLVRMASRNRIDKSKLTREEYLLLEKLIGMGIIDGQLNLVKKNPGDEFNAFDIIFKMPTEPYLFVDAKNTKMSDVDTQIFIKLIQTAYVKKLTKPTAPKEAEIYTKLVNWGIIDPKNNELKIKVQPGNSMTFDGIKFTFPIKKVDAPKEPAIGMTEEDINKMKDLQKEVETSSHEVVGGSLKDIGKGSDFKQLADGTIIDIAQGTIPNPATPVVAVAGQIVNPSNSRPYEDKYNQILNQLDSIATKGNILIDKLLNAQK